MDHIIRTCTYPLSSSFLPSFLPSFIHCHTRAHATTTRTDNYAWTESLGFDRAAPWHPWTYNLTFEGLTTEQVGGYAVRYTVPSNAAASSSFTFITVRGGRHEVPETAPEKAYEMLRRLLADQQF